SRCRDSTRPARLFVNRQKPCCRRWLPTTRSSRLHHRSTFVSATQALSIARLPSTDGCRETETSYRQECPGPSQRRRGKESITKRSIGALVNLDCSLQIKRSGIERAGPLLSGVGSELR